MHQKQPLKHFLATSLRIVAERSQEYRQDKEQFSTELSICDEQIREGCAFQLKFVSSEELNENGQVECYSYSKDPQQPITMNEVQNWQTAKYKTFDEFAENHYKIWTTTFPEDLKQWKQAKCSCQAFDDDYMCNHIISIAHQLNIFEPPVENYDDKSLFVAKKGRPAKASKKPLQKD